MSPLPKKREARQKRDREDFLRVTRSSVPAKFREEAGRYAGKTYKEHLESKLVAAVESYETEDDSDKARIKRGIIRGLAMALLIYEDSYNMNDKQKLLKIERSFME